ncbi:MULTISPECIES: hypothetical protein [Mycobacterium]|nr:MULTISPECIES: hypothetical protein [Mycobacterium]MDM4143261.1 hypothetical protein [Mycobacterium sp. FLAC0960]
MADEFGDAMTLRLTGMDSDIVGVLGPRGRLRQCRRTQRGTQ